MIWPLAFLIPLVYFVLKSVCCFMVIQVLYYVLLGERISYAIIEIITIELIAYTTFFLLMNFHCNRVKLKPKGNIFAIEISMVQTCLLLTPCLIRQLYHLDSDVLSFLIKLGHLSFVRLLHTFLYAKYFLNVREIIILWN